MSVCWGALFVCCWYGWWCSRSEQSNILGALLYYSIPSKQGLIEPGAGQAASRSISFSLLLSVLLLSIETL